MLLLLGGCASQGYQGTDSTYTLYRSRMMSPEGVPADEPPDWPDDPEVPKSLFERYDAWQPR